MPSSVVIQTSFIGDVILTTPLLAELAARGPVDVVATPAGASLLAGHTSVRDVIVYDKRGADRGVGGFLRTATRILNAGHSVAYCVQGSLRSAALAWRARVPVRVGFDDAPGRVLYTVRIGNPKDRHHAERLWRLAFADGKIPDVMPAPSLNPGPAERAAVDALLGDVRRPLIVLAPGSVWATKRWPYFETLAGMLAAEGLLVVVGGADDVSMGEIIRERVPGTVVAAGKLSLLGSAELIRRARVVVTNDSSPTHLASAMGTPTVTIFGPTSPRFGFGPLAPHSRVAELPTMPCRPCHHHGPRRCPLGHWRCMVQLDAERVATVVRDVWSHAGAAA